MGNRKKIAMIGGGQIGGVFAQLISSKELGDMVLFDITEGLPQGKCLDIAAASSMSEGFSGKVTGANSYEDLKGSDIVVVTAGVPRKPGMSRDDLLEINSKIITGVAENIKKYIPDSIVIVVSNPMDAMVTLMQKVTGFPKERVFGQGGILDSSRFATFLGWELNVSPKNINAPVFGGHGDTMVPLKRFANVYGIPVIELLERKYKDKTKANEVMDAIIARTAAAGGEVVSLLKTGSAFYSPAMATVEMVEAIIRDEKKVLPCCVLCEGEFGINGYYVGACAVIGANGVEQIIEIKLNDEEKAALDYSVDACKVNIDVMKKMKFL